SERTDGDLLQLGGDAVLDAHGRLAWIHRSAGPEDRPTVEELVTVVRRAAMPQLPSSGPQVPGGTSSF
ncbi:MAG: AhpC/TSA family protein, partial [Actinomycetota bacterium]|nr:AhpC/TSA family protein [Actinomycetota bacterium]